MSEDIDTMKPNEESGKESQPIKQTDSDIEPQPKNEPLEDSSSPGLLNEFFLFLKEEKVWWMVPMMIVLFIVGVIVFVGKSSSTLAPFIYPQF